MKTYTYVTYIRTTPEKLWGALTKPELTRQYWVETWQDCDWKVGATWEMKTPSGRVINSGEVLEIDYPRRFAVSWRDDQRPHITVEGHSRMAVDLEPIGDSVKLTITQDFKTADSELFKGMSGGWPLVLASVKSLLETGQPLAQTTRRPKEDVCVTEAA